MFSNFLPIKTKSEFPTPCQKRGGTNLGKGIEKHGWAMKQQGAKRYLGG
jgi:hypothetical protein